MEKMVIDKKFWRGKKVLLTGHTGFKGSWLSIWLKGMGADLTGYALAPASHPNLYTLANVKKGMTSIIGDIRDHQSVSRVIVQRKPQIIIHMAAQAFVSHGYTKPFETYLTNIVGTMNLLEICRKLNTPRIFLNVTTDKVYDNKELSRGYTEKDPLGGSDPYSNSKAASDSMTHAYAGSFFADKKIIAATARAGNVIGGGDWSADRILPDCVRAWSKGKQVVLRKPGATRPWQHVLNPLSGYLLLAQEMASRKVNGAWNFGPSRADCRKVIDVVSRFKKAWGPGASHKISGKPSFKETNYLHVESGKAIKGLGWKPVWGLDRGLQMTAEWYKAFLNKRDMNEFTLNQIAEFELDIWQTKKK